MSADSRCMRVVVVELSCHLENVKALSAPDYVQTFKVITSTLRELGLVFGFVTKDVEGKLSILESHLDKRRDLETLDALIKFEVDNDCARTKKKDSASRALQRLNRALEFIAEFMKELTQNASAVSAGQKAYKSTLAKYHNWLIQKSVGVALNTLGSREFVLEKFGFDKTADDEIEFLNDIETALKPVCFHLNGMFSQFDIMDLP
eukprot:m.19922 g.19922  ORF g.19922 m.19922 type:complete len:205 (+) comp5192_c0_seq1:95-709(+)